MANLEGTVRSIVENLISSEILFTALDVSNTVKQVLPNVRHREVRDVVRGMFTTVIESQGWARSPITVTLADGTTAEALLYHPLTDSWDLDNKYSVQQRTAKSYQPVAAAQATLAAAQQAQSSAVNVPATQTVPAVTAPVPLPTARALWDSMFQTQPSLFPKK